MPESLETEESRVRQALRRMALIDADETPTITPLAGGVSSLIVRVDTRRGALCVKQALPELKVATHWSAPLERSHAETAWIRLVGQRLPAAVPAILGEDRESFSFAMAWLPPEQHPVWKAQLRDGVVSTDFAGQVARQLAAIHASTAHQPSLAKAFAHDQNFFALRLDPYFAAIARLHADCADDLAQLIAETAGNRIALVHGDISPKNILAGPAGPIFLDAECAVYGDPAFDAAFCLSHLLAKCLWRPASGSDFIACFDTFASTYLSAVDWEPPSGMEARIARLLAALLLARVDGKSPLEYLTDDDRSRLRKFARRWLLSPATQLAALSAAWQEELT